MPLEIRELVIRTSLTGGGQQSDQAQTGSDSSRESAALVSACVEQVLAILKDKAER